MPIRTAPWRVCGSIVGATCHTEPANCLSETKRGDRRRHADADRREILLRQLGAHFDLAALGQAEQGARAGADDLADLDIALEDQARGRRDDVELADLGAGRAELGLGHADLGISRVAGRFLGIELGLGHEAAVLERQRAVVIGLGERGVGARRLDLRGELRRLLRLDRAVDHGEHLALRGPSCRHRPGRWSRGRPGRRPRPAGRGGRRARPKR